MIWFSSDQHFFHANILKHCLNRKFSSVEEHDAHLIKVWNERVKPEDTVFTLGDFAFGQVEKSFPVLDSLNGKKILITGNHDVRHLKSDDFKSRFAAVHFGYHELEVKFEGHRILIVLCHYPLESWNKMRYNSFHLHGHCHTPVGETRMKKMMNRKDVGVDSRDDHAPWEKDELLTFIKNENNLN